MASQLLPHNCGSTLSKFRESANDEYFDENSGITSQDLEARLIDKIENVEMHGRVHKSEHGVRIEAIANDNLRLHSLHIQDENKGTEVNWHSNGYLAVTKEPTEVQKQVIKNEKSYGENSDDHKKAILGSEGFAAYRYLADLGKQATFDKIDADLDGHLTSSELTDFALERREAALEERRANAVKGDSKYIPFMHTGPVDRLEETAFDAEQNIDSLEEPSNDEWGDENEGITMADLKTAFWQHVNNNSDQIASDIEHRLRTGMPGTRSRSNTATEVEDTISGISYTEVGDHTILNIQDPIRNINANVNLEDNLISTDILFDIDFLSK